MAQSKFRTGLGRTATTALAVLLALSSISCLNGCYLAHVARGQVGIAWSSIGIDEALERADLSPADKAKLRYVQEVRAFAESDLGLKPSKNYTTYLPGPKRPITWVVTAAPKDRLEPVTWWFPIVGSVAYKGYFDPDMAKAEAASLAADGYDVYVRPAIAYSTLGWFTDPITPLLLDLDDGELASLIVHELTHGTIYAAGQTGFSESLAEFVGRRGAEEFLAHRFGPDDGRIAAFRDGVADGQLFDAFMRAEAEGLIRLYASRPTDLTADRQEYFDGMRRDFEELRPRFRTEGYRAIRLRVLNNASMLGHLAYADTAPFERAFEAAGRDWTKFFALVRAAAKSDRPLERLRELAP